MRRIIETDEDIKDVIRRFVDYLSGCEDIRFDGEWFLDESGNIYPLEQLLNEYFES